MQSKVPLISFSGEGIRRTTNFLRLISFLFFGEKSGQSFYYRKLAGNIPDSKTVKHLLEYLDILGFRKAKFVMGRGFYSEDNINSLYKEHVKFLVGAKFSFKFIKNNLDDVYEDIHIFTNFDEGIRTYGYTVISEWDNSQKRPYKGGIIKEKRRIYIHCYSALKKVPMMNSSLINALPACAVNCWRAGTWKNIRKLMAGLK